MPRRMLVLLIGLWVAGARAETSVWRVSDDANELLLGGTLHLLRVEDFPLPAEFEAAYETADRVVFETDPGELLRPEAQQRLLARGLYPEGRSLREAVSPRTWEVLASWSEERGVALERLARMRAPLAAMTVSLVELAHLGVNQAGIDAIYFQRARAGGKPTAELETLGAQLDALFGIGSEHEDALLRQALDELETVAEEMARVVSAWRAGDLDRLDSELVAPMRTDYPALYRSLLVERNGAWLPVLREMLASPETEFVLVGVAHLAGPDGLLERLADAGYDVTRYTAP